MQTFELNPQKIKEMRLAMGLTLDKFAAVGGPSRATVAQIEKGELKGAPRAETMNRLKKALGIEGEIVWTGEIRTSVRDRKAAAKPQPAPASSEEDTHTYTIAIRTPASERRILTTEDKREAHCKYAALCAAGCLPRVIMDGRTLPIYIADKMFPQRQGDTHRRYETTKNKKRKSQPAG